MSDDFIIFSAFIDMFKDFLSWKAVYFGFELSNSEIMVGLCVLSLFIYFIYRILD